MTPKRRLRIARIILALVILAPAVAAAAFVISFDPNRYKPDIIGAVKRATGRDLALRGPLSLRFSLNPTIAAEDVALANIAGGSRPEMATVGRADAQIALLPLLHRELVINRLVLVRPGILLETDRDGRPNWRFGPEVPSQKLNAAGPSAPRHPLSIALRSIQIDEGNAGYRNGKTGQSIAISVPHFEATEQSPNDPITFAASLAYNGLPLAVRGETGPLATLRDPTAVFPLALGLEAGGATLTVSGALTQPAELAGAQLDLESKIPNLASLSPFAGHALPGIESIEIGGKASWQDGALMLRQAKLQAPQGDLTADLVVKLGARPGVNGAIASTHFDLDALPQARPTPSAAPGPAQPPPNPLGAQPQRIFSDRPLPLPWDELRSVNADLKLAFAAVQTHGTTVRNIAVHGVLRDGRLILDPASADLPGGHADGKLTIDATRPTPALALTAHAPSLALAPILAALKLPSDATGALEIDSDLRGSGSTPHELAASLDGHLGVASVNGAISNQAIGAALDQVLRQARLPEIANRIGRTPIRCFAARADMAHGIGQIRALLLDTPILNIEGTGATNLGSETIDLRLRPLAKLGGTGVILPVRVDGPLRSPRAQPDIAPPPGALNGAAKNGAFGLVIGALAGEKSIAPAADPCPAALALARNGQPGPVPAAPEGSAMKGFKPADLLRQFIR
ncbi:MAG: AsmA family protein [Acetobacteraceae bacterium]|nr:AsmA family protein [Acetobacteraceae bacterium]